MSMFVMILISYLCNCVQQSETLPRTVASSIQWYHRVSHQPWHILKR